MVLKPLTALVHMTDLELINEFIAECENNRLSSHLINIIIARRHFGLQYGHIFHSIKALSVIEGFSGFRVLEMGVTLPDKLVFYVLK